MAQFPALPLFTDAYLADTRHLSTEQHGAYLLLLMEAWRRPSCSLPDDDEMLARLAGMNAERWAFNRDAVMAFWKLDGRRKEWTQLRLTDEREYVREKRRSQSDKSRKRWNKREKGHAAAMPEGMPEACPDDAPTPTPTEVDTIVSTLSETAPPKKLRKGKSAYTPEYEAFWKAYPSTIGMSKPDGFKVWQQLSAEDQAQALASLPAYAALLAREQGRKVKHVQGYLSGRMFESFAAAPNAETDKTWQTRLGWARGKREWSTSQWGPLPGQPGCRVPAHLLDAADGKDWHEARAA